MNKSEQYKRNAADCLRAAEDTTDNDTRATLLDLARAWVRLAEQAELNSKADVVYEPPSSSQKPQVVLQQQQTQPDSSD